MTQFVDSPNGTSIHECNTAQERRAFIEFQWEIYKGDPYWVPPLIHADRMPFFDKTKNPFFEHSDAQMYVARRAGKIVGTIIAILNNRHNQYHHETTGFFGGFECINDPSIAAALFGAATTWLKARGMTVLRGPATFSLNDECGLLVEGFDSEPQVLMTYNPRYYIDLVEGYGFKKAMDLWAWWVPTDVASTTIKQKLDRIVEMAQKRKHFTIRKIDFGQLDREVAALKEIYAGADNAWQDNWGHVPMTNHEIAHIVNNLKQFADPDFIHVAELNGKTIGMGVTLPNVNRALRKAYPNPKTPELLTLAKFLWYRRSMVNSVRIILLGVLKEYRMAGVDAALMKRALDVAIEKNYTGGEMSWILENNDAMNRIISLAGSYVYKKYRIYDLPID
jgi:GNAT superfamily N-acetyltransferase